jgi:cell wall-associated NlpC family hydrolase
MAWNDLSKRVLINAIGTVESGNRWDAIYYVDPITVGFMQWFGPRAKNLLKRMMAANPGSFAGVAASLKNDLNGSHADSWWSGRYLTRAEGQSLKPALSANASVQVQQALDDLEGYASIAGRAGLSRESNTQTYILFCVEYHQSPRRALRVLNAVGGSSSVDRYRAACLNEPVLGKYRSRINTAYGIVKSMNPGNVKLNPGAQSPSPGGSDADNPAAGDANGDGIPDVLQRQDASVSYIQPIGDRLRVQTRDGKSYFANLQNGLYVTSLPSQGAVVPSTPGATGVTPAPDAPGDGSKAARIVQWMASRAGKFGYTNGPARWDPDRTGYGDCSSTIRRAYLDVAGIDIGGRSFEIARRGREVQSGRGPRGWDLSLWRPGDVVCMGLSYARSYASNGISHVELYAGDGWSWGHGGGASGHQKGPTHNRIAGRGYLGSATVWTVRRFL